MKDLSIHIQEITFGSDLQKASIQLREMMLRKPLGLIFRSQELESESDSNHFGLLVGDVLASTLVLQPLNSEVIKMRQVATHQHYQGLGYGTMLNTYCESWCKKNGYKHIVLHAREAVIGFYSQMGYEKVGSLFTEVGIPHIKMEKRL